MPRRRPRWDHLEPAKQHAILEIAAEEFAQHGFEGASYNRIIARAQVSKGAMYYYFDGKIDLFCAVVEAAMAESLSGWSIQPGLDFWPSIEAMAVGFYRLADASPRDVALYRQFVKLPEHHLQHAAILTLYAELHEVVDTAVAAGQASGEVRTDLPQTMLLAAVWGLGEALDKWFLDHVHLDLDPTHAARQVVSLLRRLAAPESA